MAPIILSHRRLHTCYLSWRGYWFGLLLESSQRVLAFQTQKSPTGGSPRIVIDFFIFGAEYIPTFGSTQRLFNSSLQPPSFSSCF
ncbi:hypothetical protein BDR26DRAFT_858202 [Obelidium mucronatum]|nr:hypothetical protein BDR26DRAFT_858202 [Obelidium mucronatum]